MNRQKTICTSRALAAALKVFGRNEAFVLIGMFVISVFAVSASAQSITDLAPPPLKLISEDEKAKLDATPEVKKHTKLVLEFMSARLKNAETYSGAENYDAMFTELGRFHALMDHMLAFLVEKDTESGKVLNNLKRFEIGLRAFGPRLELIRRDLPLKYEAYIRSLIKYLRESREKAVQPLFGDTVVPDKNES